MKANTSFNSLFQQLLISSSVFDADSIGLKSLLLKNLNKKPLAVGKTLIAYSDVLLFLCSHPQNKLQLKLAEKELKRILAFLKQKNNRGQDVYENTGLPYSSIYTRFSHDCLSWILSYKNYSVTNDPFPEDESALGNILKLTLPILERERTAAGYSGSELLEALKVRPNQQLEFLVQQLNKFNNQPFLKDQLLDTLDLYVKVELKTDTCSKLYNRLSVGTFFYQDSLLKKFDSRELLDRKLPPVKPLSGNELKEVVFCIKNSLFLKSRETDPVTYMDESSLRLFDLERGISVAIYGITPDRQLPLESYIGYTLFKNGFPAAYGGSWVFGFQALFGMNVFESYRGGESAFMMCQLLRVYRQVFRINYFEIEPYQFGKDNPEGIESGAYWFYYRLGFRSIEKEQSDLAEKENQKIKAKKGYRSSHATLKRLAESYIALTLGDYNKITVGGISQKVTAFIEKNYGSDREKAEKAVTGSFKKKTNLDTALRDEENESIKEMAFVSEVLKITSSKQLELLKQMTLAKPKDVYKYQELLREFFGYE